MPPATTLLDDLAQALLDEERARSEVRAALGRQAALLCQLRSLGVPATKVAQRIAAHRGQVLPVADRLRFARCLRKRAERETARRADLPGAHGLQHSPTAPSDQAAISPPVPKENTMPQILKRTTTTTEEFIQPDELDGLELDEEPALEDLEDDTKKKASPVRPRHR